MLVFKEKGKKPEKHVVCLNGTEITSTIMSSNRYIINEITPPFDRCAYLLIRLISIRHC